MPSGHRGSESVPRRRVGGGREGFRAELPPAPGDQSQLDRGRVLLLEPLPDLEDEGRHGGVVDAPVGHAKTLSRDPRHVAGQWREAPLLGAGRDTREIQELQRHLGIQCRRVDFGRAPLRRRHPTLTQLVEKSIHGVTYSTPRNSFLDIGPARRDGRACASLTKSGGTQMTLRWILRAAAVVAVLGLTVAATSADEATLSMHAKLNGFQEVTPKLSPSTGHFEATVTGSTLSYTLTYTKLSSPAFMAHIHFGQPAVNGGVFLWLCGSTSAPGPAGTPTCPPDGGTVSRSVTASDIVAPVPTQNLAAGDFAGALAIIAAGDAYVNIHTSNYIGGEIRGAVKSEG